MAFVNAKDKNGEGLQEARVGLGTTNGDHAHCEILMVGDTQSPFERCVVGGAEPAEAIIGGDGSGERIDLRANRRPL